jgi:hypothetical protein
VGVSRAATVGPTDRPKDYYEVNADGILDEIGVFFKKKNCLISGRGWSWPRFFFCFFVFVVQSVNSLRLRVCDRAYSKYADTSRKSTREASNGLYKVKVLCSCLRKQLTITVSRERK